MYILNRFYSDFFITRGALVQDNGRVLCHTLELPWKNNQRNISCIPAGKYDVIKVESPKFGSCFYVKDVPDRDAILFHSGNSIKDTRGCIIVGLDVSDTGVMLSRLAMDRLLSVFPSAFQLLIKDS